MSGASGRARALPAVALLVSVATLWAGGWLPVTGPAERCGVLEQLLPGLGRQDGAPATALFGAPSPPPGANLAVQALQPERAPRPAPSHAGLVALLLSFHAVVGALIGPPRGGSPGPWTARSRALLGLAGAAVFALLAFPGLGAPAAWLVAAGALHALSRPAAPGEDPLPALLLGAVSVALAAAAAGLALHAGSAQGAVLLDPLLGRLDAAARQAATPAVLERNAAHLQAVLDRTALAAFAAMVTVLVHLKARRPATGLLVVAALILDLLSVAPR